MFAEVVCKDIAQLKFVLHDELQKIKGIERTDTIISLEESFSRNVRMIEPEKSAPTSVPTGMGGPEGVKKLSEKST
jgi:hypothetical protein